MRLLQLQRQMASSILRPLTVSDRLAPRTDTGFIKPNSRLTSAERLEIYSRSYWFRVLDSLYEDFPGLRAVLGRRAFHRLSQAYLADRPSQSFTLRNLGSRLEDWLRRNLEYAGKRDQLALDMVRLEWAHIEAFDGATEKTFVPEDLLELNAKFRVGLQPYVRLLALKYPVDDLRIAVNQTREEHGAASNARGAARNVERKRRNLTGPVKQLKPERIFLAVHRLDFTVYYRRLEPVEYNLLDALGAGKSIGAAIRSAFTAPAEEQEMLLRQWFAAWAQLGWLTRKGKVCR